jgi:diamine N-acetyltransferase
MADLTPDTNVSLRRITAKTVRTICNLSVSDSQKKFVASNAISIAQAHFCKNAWFRAIYAGETPVGFVMLNENPARGIYCLWRFMIDAKYQGRGYGRKALDLVIKRVRKRPWAKALTLSVVRGEGGPEAFYEKFGFIFTGKVKGGEHAMKLDLTRAKKTLLSRVRTWIRRKESQRQSRGLQS